MRFAEKGAPAAAVMAALSTLACCAPLGFLSALGLASLSVWVAPHRTVLLILATVLLAVGFVQLYFRKSCAKRSTTSVILFWTAFGVIVLVILFPQVIANLIAG